ncbi:MAG: hypothetical protein K0S70_3793 [Microbacterium sp.]|jgi:hypothetical protein|nr:hypothetical protein [Microbacterium sp.]
MIRTGNLDVTTPLRRVAPPEVPFAGEILATSDGAVYRVSAADVPRPVWAARPDGHLLAVEDVDRIAGTTVAILPLLDTRLCGGEQPFDLTPGQAVTLAVSVLRGAAEAAESDCHEGEWWSTTQGRPVLVPSGDRAWELSSRLVLDRIADAVLPRRIRDRLDEALSDRVTLPFTVPGLEDDLFAVATPEPFAVSVSASSPSARDVREHDTAGHLGARPGPAPLARDAAAGLVDGEVVERLTDVLSSVRAAVRRVSDRLPARRGGHGAEADDKSGGTATGRRRVPVVALAAVATTLVVGLLWPEGGESDNGSASARDVPEDSIMRPTPRHDAAQETSAAPVPAAEKAPAPVSGAPEDDEEADPVGSAIDELARCWREEDEQCRAAILERPDAALPEGVATSAGPREANLLDDLGGVEVVRVDDPSGTLPAQVVVLVRRDDKRLVRDVYDVADQP